MNLSGQRQGLAQVRTAHGARHAIHYFVAATHLFLPLLPPLMFKKKAGPKPKVIRRRASFEDEDEKADEDGDTTQQKIAQTIKKRKLLSSFHSKRGVDAADLLKATVAASEKASQNNSDNKSSAVKTAAETSRDGALEQKHRQAMEEFIASRMSTSNQGTETSKAKNSHDSTTANKGPLSEDALYMDLAAQSAKLAGKPLSDDVQEERSAVLVAGTGIAEVILPVEERLQVVPATTEAAKVAAAARQNRRVPDQPSAVPNRFAVASTLTQQEFDQQYARNHLPAASSSQRGDQKVDSTTEVAEDGRMGFEAMRQSNMGQPGQASGTTSRRDQASDHKVFTKFVARQREMRK